MPIHGYSQPNAQPLTTSNASIRIKECVLSQAVSSPIMSQIGLFLTKSTLITTSFPRSRYLRTKGVSADLRYIEQEVRINAIPPIFYRLKVVILLKESAQIEPI